MKSKAGTEKHQYCVCMQIYGEHDNLPCKDRNREVNENTNQGKEWMRSLQTFAPDSHTKTKRLCSLVVRSVHLAL